MTIDPIATAAVLTVASVAMAVALMSSSARQPSPVGPAQRIWALALVCAPAGWVLLEISHDTEPLALLAIPAKALIIASFVGYLHALMVLRGSLLPAPWQQLPVLAVALATAGFYLLWPDQPMRTGLLSVLCAMAATASTVIAGRDAGAGGNRHGSLVSVAFAVSATALALRAMQSFLPDLAGSLAWAQTPALATALLGTAMLAPMVASLGFVLMCSDRLLGRLETFASADELTGLANRMTFLQRARGIVTDARQHASPCALLRIELDRSTLPAHQQPDQATDMAVASVARTLRAHLREGDCIGRTGEREFTVILQGHSLESAHGIAQRLCQAVAATCIAVDGERFGLSVSIGAAELLDVDDNLDAMHQRAGRAQQQAQLEGGNRSRIYSIEAAPSPTIQINDA